MEELSLRGCKLKSLPTEIFMLRGLKRVDVTSSGKKQTCKFSFDPADVKNVVFVGGVPPKRKGKKGKAPTGQRPGSGKNKKK